MILQRYYIKSAFKLLICYFYVSSKGYLLYLRHRVRINLKNKKYAVDKKQENAIHKHIGIYRFDKCHCFTVFMAV